MQITPFPLNYPEPIKQQPPSPAAPSQSMSAEVCLLIEMIQLLKALLKERTLMPLSSPLSHPPQSSHPPLLSYHQVDLLAPNPLIFPLALCDEGTLSYLPPGWPLSLPPTIFTPHWEQLQSGALHLPLILWNLFLPLLQPHHPQAWIIVPIPHESHLLLSPFLQDLATQVQSFWTDAIHVG